MHDIIKIHTTVASARKKVAVVLAPCEFLRKFVKIQYQLKINPRYVLQHNVYDIKPGVGATVRVLSMSTDRTVFVSCPSKRVSVAQGQTRPSFHKMFRGPVGILLKRSASGAR